MYVYTLSRGHSRLCDVPRILCAAGLSAYRTDVLLCRSGRCRAAAAEEILDRRAYCGARWRHRPLPSGHPALTRRLPAAGWEIVWNVLALLGASRSVSSPSPGGSFTPFIYQQF